MDARAGLPPPDLFRRPRQTAQGIPKANENAGGTAAGPRLSAGGVQHVNVLRAELTQKAFVLLLRKLAHDEGFLNCSSVQQAATTKLGGFQSYPQLLHLKIIGARRCKDQIKTSAVAASWAGSLWAPAAHALRLRD